MKRLITLFAVGALAVAGCGGGDDNNDAGSSAAPAETTTTEASSGGGGGGELQLTAVKEGLAYDKKTLSADAGSVTITMKNDSSLSHDVSIEGNGVDEMGDAVGEGATSTVTADLKPGSYTFYCSVDGHEAAGMKGTLTVK
jgi:plastocyanin